MPKGYNEQAKCMTNRYSKEVLGKNKVTPNKIPPIQQSIKRVKQ